MNIKYKSQEYLKIIHKNMNVKIDSVHFKADKDLLLYINNRIDKLTNFYDGILNGNVILKIGNNIPNNKIVEIKLICKGHNFYASKESKSFEKSVDLAIEALRRQIRKRKTKITKN